MCLTRTKARKYYRLKLRQFGPEDLYLIVMRPHLSALRAKHRP
jgi:hypothetical protein